MMNTPHNEFSSNCFMLFQECDKKRNFKLTAAVFNNLREIRNTTTIIINV